MITRRIGSVLAAVGLALCLAAPDPAAAQEAGTISVTGEAGLGLPVGSLSDVSDPGPAFRFGTSYALNESVGLQANLGSEVFESVTGPGGEGPTVRLFRLTVGPSLNLVRHTGETGFRLSVRGGAGGTAFTAGRTLVGRGSDVRPIDFTEVYFALDGGASAGYDFSRSVGAYLSAGASLSFAEEADTEPFAFLDPSVEPFSTLVSVPITAGVRLNFPR